MRNEWMKRGLQWGSRGPILRRHAEPRSMGGARRMARKERVLGRSEGNGNDGGGEKGRCRREGGGGWRRAMSRSRLQNLMAERAGCADDELDWLLLLLLLFRRAD